MILVQMCSFGIFFWLDHSVCPWLFIHDVSAYHKLLYIDVGGVAQVLLVSAASE